MIIDPGCFDEIERMELMDYIKENNLKPVRLINTHCHIDHILGNAFVAKESISDWKCTKVNCLFCKQV
jgi:glyoxylase-like metal-dependent hydrolase (beta-lactamase superfamily II)